MEGIAQTLEGIVRSIAVCVATIIEGMAALIVIFAVLEALVAAARALIGVDREVRKEAIRLRLGRWLSVVLEFLLAADILRTAISPSWDDIGKLAAIAGIRTALNYFLRREVREASQSVASPPAAT